MQKYEHKKIEAKWQKKWAKDKLYQARDFSKKPKFYCLIEFPYPSGAGLHVGHLRSYSALDAIARQKRMQGFNVLYPIGWDAFGLPTENYAIKTGRHPKEATKENIDTFKRQIKQMGLSFDWSREINTTDPAYYQWTQWIFLKLFENGLAYQAEMPINWCPKCKIGLANEEVVAGKCERCGALAAKKEQRQWMLRITKYADRLLHDLKNVDYSDKIRIQQENWIGKSIGAEIKFRIKGSVKTLKVFTTRPDTIFGVTYMVVCPEHKIIQNQKSKIKNQKEITEYIAQAKKKSDLQRTDLAKEKTGVEIKGIKAINPVNQEEIPIWLADYILPHYGTGAIMAVPDYDERDREFAQKYNLKIKKTELVDPKEIVKRLGAKEKVNYKLRDWVFSRQHYWGEPIPIIHCEKCGVVPVPAKDLPVKLPSVKNYKPTRTGESPLAEIKNWVKTQCPKCNSPARRETDTMPNWAGSSWYFLRYCDPKNNKKFADFKKLKYWLPVDIYNGGMEHTTLHLLYSRFWHKFLYDLGLVPSEEPYQKRRSHGMVLAEDNSKMSKSFGNVINPDDIILQYGADALRLYEMFMGPFPEAIPWSTNGIIGMRRFLEKIWQMFQNQKVRKAGIASLKSKIKNQNDKSKFKNNQGLEIIAHKTIKKISEDIDNFKFNTAIAQLMTYVNALSRQINKLSEKLIIKHLSLLLKLLAPFAPHITEELWNRLQTPNSKLLTKQSIHLEKWPKYNPEKTKDSEIELIIQVNGKMRGKIKTKSNISEKDALSLVRQQEKFKKYFKNLPAGRQVKKTIFVPAKLINLVV